jgi:hypothetical protein
MNKFEFSIETPAKGKAVGTTAWVLNQLKNAKISICTTNINAVALFFNETAIVVFDERFRPEYDGWDKNNQQYKRAYSSCTDSMGYGIFHYLFDCTLTPSAENLADEFLDKCEKILREYIESDETTEVDFELVKK